MSRITRRSVLAGGVATPWLASQALSAAAEKTRLAAPRMDVHVHLFGKGDNGSGCRLSRTVIESPTFQVLVKMLRLPHRAKTLDEGYVLALAEQLQKSGLEKALIYAQDAVYNRKGEPDWAKTPFYVPNDYLFQVVNRYPKWMMPCVSINPDRKDAVRGIGALCRQGSPRAEDPSAHPGRRSCRQEAHAVLSALRGAENGCHGPYRARA